jgi:hypothetical protein
MSKQVKTIDQPSFLTPRKNKADKFKVYAKSFIGNKQFDAIQNISNERTICIDPEAVYRLATLGMDRAMIAAYYGITKAKFAELCEEYSIIDEVFLMGMSAGLVRTAQKLEEMVDKGELVPVLFRLKIGGFIEAEKLIGKQTDENSAARVQVFLPSNGRDDDIVSEQ